MLEDHLKNVQDELGTTQVRKDLFRVKRKKNVSSNFRDFIMHVKMKLKPKII